MSKFSETLKYLRRRENLSQAEFADKSGLSRSAVAMYESGKREPGFETLELIADFFNVDLDFLTGRRGMEQRYISNIIPTGFRSMPDMQEGIPLVGDIACGSPITAEENVREYIPTPKSWRATFALECHGDSMAPKILDGDIVAIRKQYDVENGQVAAVRIGEDATLKRVYKYPGKLILQAENADYDPIVLVGDEISTVVIEGLAVGLMRNI